MDPYIPYCQLKGDKGIEASLLELQINFLISVLLTSRLKQTSCSFLLFFFLVFFLFFFFTQVLHNLAQAFLKVIT